MVAEPVSYYARLREGESVAQPRYVLRRVDSAPAPTDELLGPDGEWQPTDMLARTERGELDGTLAVLPEVWVGVLVDNARKEHARLQEALDRQARGAVTLRLARVAPSGDGEALDADEMESVVAFLTGAPLAGTGPDGLVRTDGMWVWPESVSQRATADGTPPEPEFLLHIRNRQYRYPAEVGPEVLDRARRLSNAPQVPGERAEESAVPGQPPAPTRQERLRALSAWHAEWSARHAEDTPYRPEGHRPDSEYDLHYVDVEASAAAEEEFTRRAREIMGLDPETGARSTSEDCVDRMEFTAKRLALLPAAIDVHFGQFDHRTHQMVAGFRACDRPGG